MAGSLLTHSQQVFWVGHEGLNTCPYITLMSGNLLHVMHKSVYHIFNTGITLFFGEITGEFKHSVALDPLNSSMTTTS